MNATNDADPAGVAPDEAAGGPGFAPRPPVPPREAEGDPEPAVRFRDNRRIDPDTFQVRQPDAQTHDPTVEPVLTERGAPAPVDAESQRRIEELTREMTQDLQRLSAEYANYRRRVERDRDVQRQTTMVVVLSDLLPVLDIIERARAHGELEGGYASLAESVESVVRKHGLEAYGAPGERFDPTVHEAMTSDSSPDVTEPTVTRVYQPGYRVKDRVVRAARVGVTNDE